MLSYIIVIVSAYLLGSVSMSVLISRIFYTDDVRSHGSGNAGATNMARVYGLVPGFAVLVLAALKTVLACIIGRLLLGGTGFCLAGIFCLIGHCYPVFFRFSGGKGVSAGVVLALLIDWRVFLIAFVLFLLLFFFTRIISVCSMSCAVVIAIASILLRLELYDIILAVFLAAIILVRHRSNIIRLLHGQEAKFTPGKKQ